MKYLVFFGIIAALFVSGQCFQCFKCSGNKCDVASELKEKVNCTGTSPICYKQINNEHANKKVVKRGCFDSTEFAETFNASNTVSTEVYFCDKETCNGVGSFVSSLSIVLVTLVALMFANERW